MNRQTSAIVASLFFSLLLFLQHTLAQAQEIKVTVSVEGKKKSKKVQNEVKNAVCESILDHLTFNLPDMKLPNTCNTDAKDAVILLKAEAIFDTPPTLLNVYLELRNLADGSIMKQKAHTIEIPKGTKEYQDLVYTETTAAMKDLVPQGWKPHIVKVVSLTGEPKEGEEKETPGPALPVEPVEPAPPVEPPGPAGAEQEAATEAEQAPPPAPVKEPEHKAEPVSAVGLLLAVSVKDAKVTIDGKALGQSPFEIIKDVSPGKHQITAEKEGYKKYSRSLEIPAAGEPGTYRYDIILEDKDGKKKKKGVHKKWWFWTVIGVVVAGGGGATAAILLTKDKTNAVPFPGY